MTTNMTIADKLAELRRVAKLFPSDADVPWNIRTALVWIEMESQAPSPNVSAVSPMQVGAVPLGFPPGGYFPPDAVSVSAIPFAQPRSARTVRRPLPFHSITIAPGAVAHVPSAQPQMPFKAERLVITAGADDIVVEALFAGCEFLAVGTGVPFAGRIFSIDFSTERDGEKYPNRPNWTWPTIQIGQGLSFVAKARSTARVPVMLMGYYEGLVLEI